MKYITQFVVQIDDKYANDERYIEYRKMEHASELGRLICSKTGFIEVDRETERLFECELMAFRIAEYRNFKKTLKDFLQGTTISSAALYHIGEFFLKLENGDSSKEEAPEIPNS